MDYLVPTASEAPQIEIAHVVSPSPLTPLGSKGLGESSSMTVPAVIANAVSDALAPLGIRINELPMTPSNLWKAIDQARQPRTGVSEPRASFSGHPRSKPTSRTSLP
jgi:2-furoyl-CoA dehydrogenase large subunit